ncbi:MAG: porin [Isosphaeraceae bacterium]
MKTPFTYEFYVEPVQGLILPERSLFFNNFGQNRDMGVMAFGRVFNDRLDYAVGIYNGFRNGYYDNNDGKAISGLLNFKPFANAQDTILENLNIGGSVFAQHLMNAPVPQTFRTIVPIAGNAVFGVPFLSLNNNVREAGFSGLWDAHIAYFVGPWAVVAEYGGGRQQYALASNLSQRTSVPVQSFYVESGLLLTGETRSAVGVVKPNRPFDPRPSKFGLGAWELTARVEQLDIGRNVFSAGFADPNLWSNRVDTVSLGFNWHLNQYTKFAFMWEHMVFGSPVLYAPDRFQLTSDLFLARLQLYF